MVVLVYHGFVLSSEEIDMEPEAVVKHIYESMNKNDVNGLVDYLADDIQIIPLSRPTEIISGKEAVVESIGKMLSIAKETKVTFTSEPLKMGSVVTVEYTHDYNLEDTPTQDHNVSMFVFSNGKVLQWVGYIHPK